jgi:hypothetical protein
LCPRQCWLLWLIDQWASSWVSASQAEVRLPRVLLRRETDRSVMVEGHATLWEVVTSTLSASVVWDPEIVIGAFALSGLAIVFCDGRGRRPCHAGGESLHLSGLDAACRFGLCLHLGVDSDHCHCSDCDSDADSDPWSHLWRHTLFCVSYRLRSSQALLFGELSEPFSLAL